jgi:putative transposase
MPSTHSNILLHIIYITKNRCKVIADEWRSELFSYIGGTVHDHKAILLEAGGVEDHIHLLIRSHPSFAISDTVRLIKANSSRWVNDHRKLNARFEWQKGYGVFSVSQSGRQAIASYIQNQRQHHQKQTFEQEYLRTLELHEIEYDPRFVFDEEIIG